MLKVSSIMFYLNLVSFTMFFLVLSTRNVHLPDNSKILVTAKCKPSTFPFWFRDLGLKLWTGIWPPRACPKKKKLDRGSIRSSPRFQYSL